MKEALYKETQPLYWFITLLGIIAILILLAGYFQWGPKPVPMDIAVVIAIVTFMPVLAFYNLTIKITTTHALLQFGVGPFKRKVALSDLDLDKAEIIQTNLATGIGYRITTRGILFNTRTGSALYIPAIRGKSLFVGTKNGQHILDILRKHNA